MKKLALALVLLPLLLSATFAQSAAPDPAAGKALWEGPETHCKNCHGKLGEGGLGPDLAGRGLSEAQFRHAVRKPWGIMPTFVDSQISDAELANMAAHFSGLAKVAEPAPWKFTVGADAPRGQKILHDAGCAQCHGQTFDFPRGALGGTQGDFVLFQDLVYKHTDAMEAFEASIGNAPAANRPPPRLRMGNYNPMRVTPSQLQEIYNWARDDLGFRPYLQARLTAAVIGPKGATYTLNVVNNGIKDKGLAAEGMTVALAIPAGTRIVATTGEGYKGVRTDAQAKAMVAEWLVPCLAAKDMRAFTVTLSKPGTAANNLKGSVRWTRPAPKSGPNLDVVMIGPAPLAP